MSKKKEKLIISKELNNIIQNVFRTKFSSATSINPKLNYRSKEKSNSFMNKAITLEATGRTVLINGIVSGLKGSRKVKILLDTGAEDSMIELGTAATVGAELTGKNKKIYGVTSEDDKSYILATEAEVHIELIHNNESVNGHVRLSAVEGVSKMTGGCPILLGMDYLTFERGKKLTLIIE